MSSRNLRSSIATTGAGCGEAATSGILNASKNKTAPNVAAEKPTRCQVSASTASSDLRSQAVTTLIVQLVYAIGNFPSPHLASLPTKGRISVSMKRRRTREIETKERKAFSASAKVRREAVVSRTLG